MFESKTKHLYHAYIYFLTICFHYIGQNQNIDVTEHPIIIEIEQHSEGNNL